MNTHQLQAHLAETPVSQVRYFDTAGSTNDEALVWSDQGAPDFSLVASGQQTSGRGRGGRRWVSNPGSSLAFSVLLHLTAEEEAHAGLIPLMAGAAVCRALEHHNRLKPQIKWPNDILLNGKKTAGILVESTWQGDVCHAVIGIGVNMTAEAVPELDPQALPGTSIEEAAGMAEDRWMLLKNILDELGCWRVAGDWRALTLYIQEHLAYHGQQVMILENEMPVNSGLLSGIQPDGSLMLDTADGTQIILSGDLRLRLNNR